jgi:hypothetical protein
VYTCAARRDGGMVMAGKHHGMLRVWLASPTCSQLNVLQRLYSGAICMGTWFFRHLWPAGRWTWLARPACVVLFPALSFGSMMICSYQVPCVPLIFWCFEGQLGSISYGCLPGTATVFVAVASCRKPKAGGFLTQALCSEGDCPACGNTSA